jgi:hypothetical protein
MLRGSLVPAAISALAMLGFVATIDRVPIPWTDEVIYASIARAMQLTGTGVPTVLDGAPAIDHVGFYGPVYFGFAARLFDVFGFSMASFRAVGVLGALLTAASGALIARALGQSRARQWWTAALLLLTPEVGRGATDGRMDTLALGLSLLALAVYLRGLASGDRPVAHGIGAGASLAAAALTVPRVYPFVAVFMVLSLLVHVSERLPAARRVTTFRLWLPAAVTLGTALVVWAVMSHGGVLEWLRFHWYIASREDLEIAVIPGTVRRWSATPWQVVTSLAAGTGFAVALSWRRREGPPMLDRAATLALAIAAVNFLVTAWIMNLTFALGSYFAVGLLAVVLAVFPRTEGRRRQVALALVGVLLVVDVSVRLGRYARVVATWPARDPAPIDRFVRQHVPAGSLVYGPNYFYIYAVERAGSRYLAASRLSAADWTRQVPQAAPATPLDARTPRYMLWPADEVPDLVCEGARVVARFDPPADNRRWLGPLGRLANSLPDTYHPTRLWRWPPGC